MAYRKVENEDICCVSHRFVEDHNKNDKNVANEADNDDEGEENGDHDGDNSHQDLKMFFFIFLLS